MRENRLAVAGAAADQCADAGQQLGHVVGLDHVVVGARVEAGDAVADRIARGGDQHRHVVAPPAQAAQHIEAVAARQTQVEQHQVIAMGAQGGVGHLAVAHPVDRIVLPAQQVEQRLADHGVVFYEQQAHEIEAPTARFATFRNAHGLILGRPRRTDSDERGTGAVVSWSAMAVRLDQPICSVDLLVNR